LWDFGDRTTSTERNPTHTYLSEGIYTVSLRVQGNGKPDDEVKTGYIQVTHNSTNTTTTPNGTTTTTTLDSINNPPNKASNPYPADGATKAPVEVMLSWDGSDPNSGDNVTYDVYLGFVGNVKFYMTTSNALCAVRDLQPSTTYNWKIVATDNHGGITEGPIWSFTTEKTSSGCAAEAVLADDPESLTLLRQFRDRVLAKSANGKAIIKLYYEKSPQIVKLLYKNPDLKAKYRTTLKAMMPSIRKAVENKSALRH
jgi:hypothetical protein